MTEESAYPQEEEGQARAPLGVADNRYRDLHSRGSASPLM